MVIKTKAPEITTQLAFETVITMDITRIKPNPYQPEGRTIPSKEIIDRISASIKEFGLLQTPVIRQCQDGQYEMADGWIRLCGYAELNKTDPAGNWKFLPVIIRNLTDKQMADKLFRFDSIGFNYLRSELEHE